MDLDQAIRDRLHMGYKSIAQELGVTAHAVRARMDALNLKSDHAINKARVAALRANPAPTDDDLVAIFLATKTITQLPSGQACGLTQWERSLWTAGANTAVGWKAQNAQRNKNAGTGR